MFAAVLKLALFRPVARALAALAGAAALAAGAAATVQAAECRAPFPAPTTDLVEKQGEVRFSNGFSGPQLERKRRQAGSAATPGADWHPVGLMGRDMVWGFRIQVQAHPLERGYCVGLAHAEMTIGFERIDVYVDRRYRAGTCAYQAILDHENQHVRNFRDTLAAHLPALRQTLEKEAAAARPITAASPGPAADHFIRHLRRRLDPMVSRIQKEAAALDRALDSPESYQATQARCDDW